MRPRIRAFLGRRLTTRPLADGAASVRARGSQSLGRRPDVHSGTGRPLYLLEGGHLDDGQARCRAHQVRGRLPRVVLTGFREGGAYSPHEVDGPDCRLADVPLARRASLHRDTAARTNRNVSSGLANTRRGPTGTRWNSCFSESARPRARAQISATPVSPRSPLGRSK